MYVTEVNARNTKCVSGHSVGQCVYTLQIKMAPALVDLEILAP